MTLEPCPCCLGKPEMADMMVGDIEMWQVTCPTCGLATELDDDKAFTEERWNKRLEKARLKMWVTLLAAFIPFVGIAAFLGGSFLGINL